jgi:hypothetical protein
MTVMLGIGGILAEAIADVAIRPVPITADDATEMIDELRTQALLGAVPGRARSRSCSPRATLGLSATRPGRPRRLVSADLNPLIVVDGRPDRGRRAGRGDRRRRRPPRPRRLVQPAMADAAFGRCSTPAAWSWPARRPTPASSASCRSTTSWPWLRGQGVRHQPRRRPGPGHQDGRRASTTCPTARPTSSSCAPPASSQPRPAAGCAARASRGVPDLGRLRRGGRGRASLDKPSSSPCATSSASCWPAPTGRVWCRPGRPVRADRGAVPAGGLHRRRQPVGQLRVVVLNYGGADGRRHQSGRERRQRRRHDRGRLPRVLRRRPGHRRSGSRTSRASTTAGPSSTRCGRCRPPSRWCSSRAAPRPAGPAPRRATPVRSRPTTACSTARAARRVSPGQPPSRRRSRPQRRFATQPLPSGNRVVVMTTAGGWGVVTADAITPSKRPRTRRAARRTCWPIDRSSPPRWSRNNPVDLAGGETRDTIPEVMEMIARHPGRRSIVYLGVGIQSNQAALMRRGRFYPDHGLERIVAYHERQDARFAQAAADISARPASRFSRRPNWPCPTPTNAGPATVKATGRSATRRPTGRSPRSNT